MKQIFNFLFAFVMLAGCKTDAQSTNLSVNEFEKQISADKQLLDVRTAEEYKSGHIDKALQADWKNQTEFMERIKSIDKNKTVLIYCLGGGRSKAAAAWMRENGFTSVLELDGGINAWKQNNKPVVGASNSPQMSLTDYASKINGSTVLVDFGAEWCPPCKKMEPILQQLQNDLKGNFNLVKVDGGNDIDVMKQESVTALPVFIVYKNGKQVWRQQGVVSYNDLKKAISSE